MGVNDAEVLRLLEKLERLADEHGEAVVLESCRQFLDVFYRELREATGPAHGDEGWPRPIGMAGWPTPRRPWGD